MESLSGTLSSIDVKIDTGMEQGAGNCAYMADWPSVMSLRRVKESATKRTYTIWWESTRPTPPQSKPHNYRSAMGHRKLVRTPTGNELINVFREADGVVVYGQLTNNPE